MNTVKHSTQFLAKTVPDAPTSRASHGGNHTKEARSWRESYVIRNRLLGSLAAAFGALTLWSGGMVIFGPETARITAGQIVPHVLWFNFLSGAVYIMAGVGIFLGHRFGNTLAMVLTLALTALFATFLVVIAVGHEWEMRTLGALTLRLGFWGVAAWTTMTTIR